MKLRTLKNFAKGDEGTISTEAVLVLPILAWAFFATFTFFDAFRTQNLNVRNAYTISDLISRETNFVGPDYIDGLNAIFQEMTNGAAGTSIRISLVQYEEDTESLELVWSHGTEGRDGLTSETLSVITDDVPTMADADTVVVVETWMNYLPATTVGLTAQSFEHVVVTRPRFAPQIVWSDDA